MTAFMTLFLGMTLEYEHISMPWFEDEGVCPARGGRFSHNTRTDGTIPLKIVFMGTFGTAVFNTKRGSPNQLSATTTITAYMALDRTARFASGQNKTMADVLSIAFIRGLGWPRMKAIPFWGLSFMI